MLERRHELFRLSFPEVADAPVASAEHYQWKFRAFPAEPPAYEYAALEDENLAGYYAALPYIYRFGDGTATCGMVCDVMTHPAMRGKGVFAKLGIYATADLANRGIAFTSGYPIRPEVIPGHLRAGWRIAFKLPMYMHLLRANSLLRARRLGVLAPAANAVLAVVHAGLQAARKRKHWTVELAEPRAVFESPAYERFLAEWLAAQPIGLHKDAAFLSWRLGAPDTEYRFVVARDASGEISALAIARRTELEGIPCIALLDVMARPDAAGALGAVVHRTRAYAKATGADAVVTMMSPTWAKRYRLARLGFLRTPAVFTLILKPLQAGLDEQFLFDEKNWHVMWIDSDDL